MDTLQRRTRKHYCSVFLTAVASAAALAISASATFGDTAAGKGLFEANCAVCHKADGSGGIKFGNVVSADLRAPALEHLYHDSDADLVNAILNGKDQDGADLAAIMPRWNQELSAAQVADIIAYLKTLK